MVKLYDLNEVAALLGVKRSTLDHYISERRLKLTTLVFENGRYHGYISESDLDDFMTEDLAYRRVFVKRLRERELEERMNYELLLEQQERWDEQFALDFLRRFGL